MVTNDYLMHNNCLLKGTIRLVAENCLYLKFRDPSYKGSAVADVNLCFTGSSLSCFGSCVYVPNVAYAVSQHNLSFIGVQSIGRHCGSWVDIKCPLGVQLSHGQIVHRTPWMEAFFR